MNEELNLLEDIYFAARGMLRNDGIDKDKFRYYYMQLTLATDKYTEWRQNNGGVDRMA